MVRSGLNMESNTPPLSIDAFPGGCWLSSFWQTVEGTVGFTVTSLVPASMVLFRGYGVDAGLLLSLTACSGIPSWPSHFGDERIICAGGTTCVVGWEGWAIINLSTHTEFSGPFSRMVTVWSLHRIKVCENFANRFDRMSSSSKPLSVSSFRDRQAPLSGMSTKT